MSDGLLSRWARRKQAVRAAERAAAQAAKPEDPSSAPPPEGAIEAPAEASPEEADALAQAIARLPRIEDLTAETDLAPFLRAGIPSALRNAALRRMWSVDPGIRDFVSEAREYAYDWNTPGGVPGLGPMLPTDDIKAMVERIMTGHAPVSRPEEPERAEPAPATPAAEAAAAPEPAQDDPDPIPVHAESPLAIPPAEPPGTFQSPAIVSRLRRHGGAMPS